MLNGRRFIDRQVDLSGVTGTDMAEAIQNRLLEVLPAEAELDGSIVRLVIEYPADWEALLNETELRRRAEVCFEFHLVRRPQREARLRLPTDSGISSLTPMDLLDVYWRSMNASPEDAQALQQLARQLMDGHGEEGNG